MDIPLYTRLLEQDKVNAAITDVGIKLCADIVENVSTFNKQAVKCGYRIYGDGHGAKCAKTHNTCATLGCPFLRDGARRELNRQHESTNAEVKEFLNL